MGGKDRARRQADQAGRASHGAAKASPPYGDHPSRFPSPVIDCERCIGIVSPYGNMWTWATFKSCDEAEKHLRDFWGDEADKQAPQFKLCMVRVEVVPESEPFALPSAIATEAQRAATVKQGAVHEGAGRQASPKGSGQ